MIEIRNEPTWDRTMDVSNESLNRAIHFYNELPSRTLLAVLKEELGDDVVKPVLLRFKTLGIARRLGKNGFTHLPEKPKKTLGMFEQSFAAYKVIHNVQEAQEETPDEDDVFSDAAQKRKIAFVLESTKPVDVPPPVVEPVIGTDKPRRGRPPKSNAVPVSDDKAPTRPVKKKAGQKKVAALKITKPKNVKAVKSEPKKPKLKKDGTPRKPRADKGKKRGKRKTKT